MAETKIDVLAVLDEANTALHNTCSVMGENRFVEERLAEARAAVAELIAEGWQLVATARHTGEPIDPERLAAALARVGGV